MTGPADDGARRRGTERIAACLGAVVLAAALLAPGVAAAQEGGGPEPDITFDGLLRTGLRVGPGDLGRTDGFEVHDARVGASGRIGIVFDYRVQAEWDPRRDEVRLLDAILTLPVADPLRIELGQLKAPFGKEALKEKGAITFVDRSQASQLLAPGRQVGVRAAGEALEGRLRYAGGLFNGNGRTLENDDSRFLYAGRVEYNNVGAAEFYDELVVEVGANLAFSRDSAVDLGAELRREVELAGVALDAFRGERLLWGGDLRLGYRGFFLRGEYLRAELDLPDPVGQEVTLEGGYLEGGYDLWGAIEGVVRWDALAAPLESVGGVRVDEEEPVAGRADFLVFGLNLYPGYHTKVGLQHAVGLGGSRVGPGLADGEFRLTAQVDF